MPARRAACSGSPLATSPRRINVNASALIVMVPRASASRLVIGLAPTSTIFTRPRRSTCDSCPVLPTRVRGADPAGRRALATVLTLSKVKRQTLEGDRQIDALQLDAVRHMQRARRKVENPLNPGGDNLIDHRLCMRCGDRDDGDVEPLATRHALQFLDVEDGH